jgi:endonuclease-8
MPEGDTIYRTARTLEKALGGRVVSGFETGVAKLASVDDDAPVVGRTVERVEARGKWCLIYFSGDLILASHMLMSGSWHVYRVGEKWWMPRSRMRVAITVEGAVAGEASQPAHAAHERGTQGVGGPESGFQAVLFNAQVAEFHTARSLERSSQVPKLGPDILSGEFTVEQGIAAMRERMRTHPEDEAGVMLLNQRVMAGLGNVYKSEVAFAAGVNPFRQIRTLSERELTVMAEYALKWMKANVHDGQQRGETGEGIVTYTGPRRTTRAMDRSDRTWVYGRQGMECRRCGALVERRLQGEAARPTYWCPGCQPWVAAEGQSGHAPVGRTVKLLGGRRRIGC